MDLDKCPKSTKDRRTREEAMLLFGHLSKLQQDRRTREEAINAAGNVIGNVTVNVSCV